MTAPPYPYLGWTFRINDQNGKWWLTPRGGIGRSITVFACFALLPILGAFISIGTFKFTFYAIKVNTHGMATQGFRQWKSRALTESFDIFANMNRYEKDAKSGTAGRSNQKDATTQEMYTRSATGLADRRKVLIATLEYEILGWDVKVRSVDIV